MPDARWAAGLGRRLTALPGLKVVSCRTAVYGARLVGLGEGGGRIWRAPWTIQPLDEAEQAAFLEARMQTAAKATALVSAIRRSPDLRWLAGAPLLLGLMAGMGLPLPAKRAAFYEKAEIWMLRRQAGELDFDQLWTRAQDLLDGLATGTARPLSSCPFPVPGMDAVSGRQDAGVHQVETRSRTGFPASPQGSRSCFPQGTCLQHRGKVARIRCSTAFFSCSTALFPCSTGQMRCSTDSTAPREPEPRVEQIRA